MISSNKNSGTQLFLSIVKKSPRFLQSGMPVLLGVLILTIHTAAFAAGDDGIETSHSVVLAGSPLQVNGSILLQDGEVAQIDYKPEYEQTKKIRNIITLKVLEEITDYIPVDFTAYADLSIEYRLAGSGTTYTISKRLEVTYTRGEGLKYNARQYLSFDDAEYVKVTVTHVEGPVSGGFEIKKALVLENEMRVTRYYDLLSGVQPTLTVSTPGEDEMPVSWTLPVNAGNTHTQLEWAWVEDDLLDAYKVNGAVDYNLLFRSNSTRIDLAVGVYSYAIPTLFSGTGRIYCRIRAVNIKRSGNRTDGPWTAPQSQPYNGYVANAMNWQATVTYAEEGKRKAVAQFYDGTLRNRQTVTKDNVTNTVITAETLYDGEGRAAVQVLPAPGADVIMKYYSQLNVFNGQTPGEDPAKYFDLQPSTSTSSATPALNTTWGAARYYSGLIPLISNSTNTPDAEGYPFSVTRYTPDATGRIMAQSAPGAAFQMGKGHETKYYYGTPAQEELDGLFGTEAGNYTHYFKNMVKDPNNQMSVTYVDMYGRTIATSLAGAAPSNMVQLNMSNTDYPGQTGTFMSRNLLNANSNVVKNNSIEAINSLLVPATTLYHFTYKLDPQRLQLNACDGASTPVCYDCLYNLEISITDESGDADPIIHKFNNLKPALTDNCSDPLTTFKNESTGITTNTITLDITLPPGSYSIRKTLTISEASLQTYKDLYISKALCKTEQQLIDSVTSVLLANSDCANPPAPYTCTTCISPLPAKRQLMLADMVPYSGQYARETGSDPMYNAYNIFATGNYKIPWNSTKNLDWYRTIDGSVDQSIQPGNTYNNLNATTKDGFNDAFQMSWAEALLPHHPEYDKLVFAENNLTASYNWINTFNATTTYAQAAANGYIFTAEANLNDPFYSVAPSSYKTAMANKIAHDYSNGLSLWQLAYGDVACKTIVIPADRDYCYKNAPPTPPYNNLSAADNDRVWATFRNLYAMERDNQVNAFINSSAPLSNAQTLVDNGYLLHFPTSNNQLAQQYGNNQTANSAGNYWAWYPANAGDAPNVSTIPGGTSAQQIYTDRCNSYAGQWTKALLQCSAIANHPDKDQIISKITAGMVAVCVKGSDEANPFGSSNAPGGGSPGSFEEVINNVLITQYNIPRDNLCNPFIIEFPKPYNKGPVFAKNQISQIDTCTCKRFTQLKTEAAEAGYNATDLTSFNQYLETKYGETVTPVLFAGLVQGCPVLGTTACSDKIVRVQTPVGYGTSECECNFVYTSGGYNYYDCKKRVCTDYSYFPLATPQPMPGFLKCGFAANSCITCEKLSSLTAEFKGLFSSSYNGGPVFNGTDLSVNDIRDNVLFAQFLNYRTGLQLTWLDYAKASKAVGCDLANYPANTGATQTVVCPDAKPLIDNTGIFVRDEPCQDVKNMAVSIAQQIYRQRVEYLLANFETQYRAKCLAAKDIEQFSVDYTSREYHYTLYYYDLAGNLVKTVPPKGVNPDFTKTFTDRIKASRANNVYDPRNHTFVTSYRYNSLNGVIAQNTPDGGTSVFWYDKVGRLAVSQNAQQAIDGKYSYTIYDEFGRIKEVGQKPQTAGMNQTTSQNETLLDNWINGSVGTKEEMTVTVYDQKFLPVQGAVFTQNNLRNRISYTYVKKYDTDIDHYAASFYSYDIHGNVDMLLQDYLGVPGMTNKLITYDYDLVSGKVNMVNYQPGASDAFYHRYTYDAESRLTMVETSRDKLYWERDAAYNYYKHGPLQRTELGQLRAQGLDYAYTLQGWLKGINSTTPGTGVYDLGEDGFAPGNNHTVARDVIGFALHYYDAVEGSNTWMDYKPLTGPSLFARPASGSSFVSLYNGNIGAISINNAGLAKGAPGTIDASALFYNYRYDQLNRLVRMQAFNGFDAVNNQWGNGTASIPDYGEGVIYDPNGNIVTYNRKGSLLFGSPADMDDLFYHYDANTNRLNYITDAVPISIYADDLKSQGPNNYTYDAIGNLKTDDAAGISSTGSGITWNVYGKISSIDQNGSLITYTYDAAGNRITKTVAGNTTVYVRDAQGNVMSVYEPVAGALKQTETHLYGSKRLGMATKLSVDPKSEQLLGSSGAIIISTFTRNEKIFELTNHLNNVLATIGDKKIQHTANNGDVDYYLADVITSSDYYPFGMLMPGRNYAANKTYRYGFNGKENDNEIKGEGNQQDYGMRVYDPRIGRFLSVDPLAASYPWYTPYQFAGNRPVIAIDLDGMEPHDMNTHEVKKDLAPTAAEHKSPSDPVAFGKQISPWKDILNFRLSSNLIEAMHKRGVSGHQQKIEDAHSSDINFDYYAVEIKKLPNGVKDVGELFETIRLNLGQFMDDKTRFGAYNKGERKIWDSKNPVGAVMSFDALFEDVLGFYWNLDDASVMTSSYYKGDNGGYWTFTTLLTGGDGGHPISGTRQFGVSSSKQADGTTSYLFYIRASDRASHIIEAKLQNTIFHSAEETWNTVCNKVFNWVNSNGGNAMLPYTPISKRIPWNDVKDQHNKTNNNNSDDDF